jgi:hypothetical protein
LFDAVVCQPLWVFIRWSQGLRVIDRRSCPTASRQAFRANPRRRPLSGRA